jgi:hypothetical protein
MSHLSYDFDSTWGAFAANGVFWRLFPSLGSQSLCDYGGIINLAVKKSMEFAAYSGITVGEVYRIGDPKAGAIEIRTHLTGSSAQLQ